MRASKQNVMIPRTHEGDNDMAAVKDLQNVRR